MIDYGRLRTDLLALAVLATTVFVGLSLVSFDAADPPSHLVYPSRSVPANLCGLAGARLSYGLITVFGAGAWFVLVALIVFDIRLFARDVYRDPVVRLAGGCLLVFVVCVAAQWYLPFPFGGSLAGNGGYVGVWGAILLDQHFSRVGSLIVLATTAIAGVLLTGEQHLVRTLICFLLLPITMWSRLAFGSRKTESPPVDPSVAESTPQITDLAQEMLPVEMTGDVPAGKPDASVSRFRVNAPPLLSPDAAPRIVVSGGTLSIEAAAAIASLLGPTESQAEVQPPTAAPAENIEPLVSIPLEPASSCDESQPVENEESEPVCEIASEHHEPAPAGVAEFSLAPDRSPIRVNPPQELIADPPFVSAARPEVPREPYRLPDTALLEDAEAFPYDLLASKAQLAAAKLEKTFQEFGLNVKVVEIDTGPVITQFELELEKGLRLSKVTSLADDLAIALRVPAVRVIAPIPGKNTVGVEVPNDVRVMVRLKELIDCCRADIENKAIPMFLGKDAGGKPLVVDMCKMPHLLIAGRTGTGKSVCLNTLILSILMTRSPDQVKMLMIDPKMVELSPYSRIPHLMHPVITDMRKAEAVLGWAVDKMEERYQLLSACGVRHIDSYNKLGREKVLKKLGLDPNSDEAAQVPESMPYIVIVADEMADMMMTSGKDVEGHIIRLAQKSRAVGIHLVLATQKPTVDVITGLIKSNLPARISFQVASRMDSRVVLDEMGADKLLGKGDMLYMAPESSSLLRSQGTYVSDEEVNKVIEFFADQEPQYDQELAQLKAAPPASKGGKGAGPAEARDRDDLYDEAVEVVIREGRGSVSLLQRALGVGYGRGARMIDWMAEDGIVGAYNGSQAREVIMTLIDWEELKESRGMEVSRK